MLANVPTTEAEIEASDEGERIVNNNEFLVMSLRSVSSATASRSSDLRY